MLVGAALLLVLIGLAGTAQWLAWHGSRAIARARPSPAVMLGARRLEAEPTSAGRVVMSVAILIALGAVAEGILLSATTYDSVPPGVAALRPSEVVVQANGNGRQNAELWRSLEPLPGVRSLAVSRMLPDGGTCRRNCVDRGEQERSGEDDGSARRPPPRDRAASLLVNARRSECGPRPPTSVLRNHLDLAPVRWKVRSGTREADAERDPEVLYREHGDRLWRSIWLSTGRSEVADDAVAEAFAQAIGRREQLRDPLAWIWRTAFRVAAGEMKRMRAASPLVVEVPVGTTPSLVELIGSLTELSPKQRAALILADYAGLPHREIAEILGTSVSAVGVHVHRARRRMRVLLEVDDG